MYDDYVAPFLSGVRRTCVKALSCLYTVTPDFGFVIDTHPESERVMIVSACSGHGFKHSPAIGEALSEWVIEGKSGIDLRPFAFKRFLAGRP
jgi:sarcosine oxidase